VAVANDRRGVQSRDGVRRCGSVCQHIQTGYLAHAAAAECIQGVIQDMDGSLLNSQTLPPLAASLVASNGSNSNGGSNATLLSAIDSLMLRPEECVYFNSTSGAVVDVSSRLAPTLGQVAVPADAAWCSPSITFRRITYIPLDANVAALQFAPVYVTDVATNRSALMQYSFPWRDTRMAGWDSGAYYAVLPAGREYMVQHASTTRLELNSMRYVPLHHSAARAHEADAAVRLLQPCQSRGTYLICMRMHAEEQAGGGYGAACTLATDALLPTRLPTQAA
jgi:hypothetical protein